jgi:hypothetical protein
MPRELREVFIVRNPDGEVMRITHDPKQATYTRYPSRYTIESFSLLTPEVAAVLAAAEAYENVKRQAQEAQSSDGEYTAEEKSQVFAFFSYCDDKLCEAVVAYRVRLATDAEGQGPYAAKGEL